MANIDPLRKQMKKLDSAISRAMEANCDLAADALVVEPQLCGELGTVGKLLKEASEAYDKIVSKYL